MKYMMIVCFDPSVDPADAKGGMDTDAWVAEMDGRGVRLEGRALDPATPPPSGCAAGRRSSPTARSPRPRS